MNLSELGTLVTCTRDDQDQWCTEEKAHTLAGLVAVLRPELVVEIGVWRGASLLPMLIAMRHVNHGSAIAIDPWSQAASAAGEAPENAAWWGKVDHETAYRDFLARCERAGVVGRVAVWRKPSDECTPPARIDLLHVDGNHSDQAVRDVERFAPFVRTGGILVMDDVHWVGGHVSRALEIAVAMGFRELYALGTGCVMVQDREWKADHA